MNQWVQLMELTIYQNVAIALGLGLLVGIQREWARTHVAGIRTFPLITIFGVISAELSDPFGGWIVGAGVIAVVVIILLGNFIKYKSGSLDPGVTSEMAAVLMYLVGAVLGAGYPGPAVVVAGITAVLLHWKTPLHRFVERIDEGELTAVIRFVLIAMVILPLFPNEQYGPYGVLNPFKIWMMVALIVGISLGAYLAYTLLGSRAGTIVTGIMGGFISSTATTVSYARATSDAPKKAETAAVVVMFASAVVFARVLIEIAVVAPQILAVTAAPLGVVMCWFAAVAIGAFFLLRGRLSSPAERGKPPSNLLAAVIFGILYAVVLVAVAFAKENFGDRGLYLVAALSGLTDMDAITLSSAQMIKSGTIEADTGWRMIVTGALANLFFKAAVVGTLGNRRFFKITCSLFGISSLGGGAVLLFWPG